MSKLEELENRLKSPVQINIMHRIDNEEISAVDESEIRLLQMGMPFDRDRGVELLKEIYL